MVDSKRNFISMFYLHQKLMIKLKKDSITHTRTQKKSKTSHIC